MKLTSQITEMVSAKITQGKPMLGEIIFWDLSIFFTYFLRRFLLKI